MFCGGSESSQNGSQLEQSFSERWSAKSLFPIISAGEGVSAFAEPAGKMYQLKLGRGDGCLHPHLQGGCSEPGRCWVSVVWAWREVLTPELERGAQGQPAPALRLPIPTRTMSLISSRSPPEAFPSKAEAGRTQLR